MKCSCSSLSWRACAATSSFAERCQREAAQLRQNIEQNGWDGEWYRRAYFDDGSPLGSASNAECQIDSIAQSWSVLSGAGDAGRSRMAMEAVDQRLVRRDHALIQLLDPPFDKSDFESWLYQGIRPGREGEWRAVHSCGNLGGDGVRCPGRQPARLGVAGNDQSGEPCAISRGDRNLQSRAVCRCGRRLCTLATHWPRRMDLVYRLGWLDVPAYRGITPGAEA